MSSVELSDFPGFEQNVGKFLSGFSFDQSLDGARLVVKDFVRLKLNLGTQLEQAMSDGFNQARVLLPRGLGRMF